MVDLTLMSPEQIESLKQQINIIGDQFGEDYKEAIQTGIDNYSERAYEARIESAAGGILATGATELETSKSALEAYTEELLKNNQALYANKKIAAEATVEHFRFSKALDKLEGTVKDGYINKECPPPQNLEYT